MYVCIHQVFLNTPACQALAVRAGGRDMGAPLSWSLWSDSGVDSGQVDTHTSQFQAAMSHVNTQHRVILGGVLGKGQQH